MEVRRDRIHAATPQAAGETQSGSKVSDRVGEEAGEGLAGLAALLAAPAAGGTLGGKPFLLGFGAEEATVL